MTTPPHWLDTLALDDPPTGAPDPTQRAQERAEGPPRCCGVHGHSDRCRADSALEDAIDAVEHRTGPRSPGDAQMNPNRRNAQANARSSEADMQERRGSAGAPAGDHGNPSNTSALTAKPAGLVNAPGNHPGIPESSTPRTAEALGPDALLDAAAFPWGRRRWEGFDPTNLVQPTAGPALAPPTCARPSCAVAVDRLGRLCSPCIEGLRAAVHEGEEAFGEYLARMLEVSAPRALGANQGPPRGSQEARLGPQWYGSPFGGDREDAGLTDAVAFQWHAHGLEDAGATGRPSPPCCAPIGEWWCVLDPGHAGEHQPPRDVRPLPAPSSFDRGRRR